MGSVTGEITEVANLASSVLKLGANLYNGSEVLDQFKSNVRSLERSCGTWEERARNYGLYDDRTFVSCLRDAKKQLKQEEGRLKHLDSGCGWLCFQWCLSSTTDFPAQLGNSIIKLNLNEKISSSWKSENDADDAAGEISQKLARAPQFGFITDERYVRLWKIENQLKKFLNDEGRGSSRIILLHGRAGSGKSSMARHLALDYKAVALDYKAAADGEAQSGTDPEGRSRTEGAASSERRSGFFMSKKNINKIASAEGRVYNRNDSAEGIRKFDDILFVDCGRNAEAKVIQKNLLHMLQWQTSSDATSSDKTGERDTGKVMLQQFNTGISKGKGKQVEQPGEGDDNESQNFEQPGEGDDKERQNLEQLLRYRRTLIIFDDVWDKEFLWDMVRVCGKQGKIFVTSQMEYTLPEKMSSVQMDRIEREDSLRILKTYAGFSQQHVVPEAIQKSMGELVRKVDGHPHALASLAVTIDVRHKSEARLWRNLVQECNKRLEKPISERSLSLHDAIYKRSVMEAIGMKLQSLGEEGRKLMLLVVMVEKFAAAETLLELFYRELISQGKMKAVQSVSSFLDCRRRLKDYHCIRVRLEGERPYWYIHSLDEDFIRSRMNDAMEAMMKAIAQLRDEPQGLKLEPQMHAIKLLGTVFLRDNLSDNFDFCPIPVVNKWRSGIERRKHLVQIINLMAEDVDQNVWSKTLQRSSYQIFLSCLLDREIHNDSLKELLESPKSNSTVWEFVRNICRPENDLVEVWALDDDVLFRILRLSGDSDVQSFEHMSLNYEQVNVIDELTSNISTTLGSSIASYIVQFRKLVMRVFESVLSPERPFSARNRYLQVLRRLLLQCNVPPDLQHYKEELSMGIFAYAENELSAAKPRNYGLQVQCSIEILLKLGQYQEALILCMSLRRWDFQIDKWGGLRFITSKTVLNTLLHTRVHLEDWNGALQDLKTWREHSQNRNWDADYESFYLQERGVVKRMMGDLPGALQDLDNADVLGPQDFEVLKQRGFVKFLMGNVVGALADAHTARPLRPDKYDEPDDEMRCLGAGIVEYLGFRL